MSWRAVSDGRRVMRAPDPLAEDALLPVGTLLLELPYAGHADRPQTVLDLSTGQDWPQRLSLLLGPQELTLHQVRGNTTRTATVPTEPLDAGAELRISYSWHGPERVGLLTVETLSTGDIAQQVVLDPMPWTGRELHQLFGGPDGGATLDPDTTLLAVSDQVEPVGIRGGFGPGTLIDTAQGPRPIESLRPHDIVQTSEHGLQPIRRIVSYDVPSAGRFAPLELKSPFFGLSSDLVVAPDHKLLVSGADAEYLFGADAVLIEAHYLSRMAAARNRLRSATIRYTQVLLDAHVCVSASGAWGESLYVGDLASHPTRLATSALADVPRREVPRHSDMVGPQLKGYEAIVLVSALCA